MRLSIVIAFLFACGSKKPEPPATLAHLVSPDVSSVMRSSIATFPVLAMARDLIDSAQRCWPDLVARVTGAYQMMQDGDSYFIVEGNVPRDELEKCVPVTFMSSPKTRDDDGMLVVEFPIGNVYAAWRGNFVVIGKRSQVTAAIAEHDAATVARWEKLLPTQPAEMAIASTDLRYATLMGAGATDWFLSLDKVTKEPMFMSGTFKVHYQTPADATKAAEYIKGWSTSGRFPIRVTDDPDITAAFDGFAGAIGKLTPKVTGNELVIAYDSDQLGGPLFFAGVLGHFDKLQAKLPGK